MSVFSKIPFPIDLFVLMFPVIFYTQRNLFRYYNSNDFKKDRKEHQSLKLNPRQAKIFNAPKKVWILQIVWIVGLIAPVM